MTEISSSLPPTPDQGVFRPGSVAARRAFSPMFFARFDMSLCQTASCAISFSNKLSHRPSVPMIIISSNFISNLPTTPSSGQSGPSFPSWKGKLKPWMVTCRVWTTWPSRIMINPESPTLTDSSCLSFSRATQAVDVPSLLFPSYASRRAFTGSRSPAWIADSVSCTSSRA